MADRCFTVHDDEQRSDAWRQLRLGRVTGSRAADMLRTIKSGAPAESRANLKMALILEQLTSKSHERDFVSEAMQTGIDREGEAIAAYEARTGDLLLTTGFLAHRTLMAGCSPDAFLGDFDVLISVKCRQPKAHWEYLRTGKIPLDAQRQMLHELWLTGAREHQYVSWNPDFPERHRLKIDPFTAASPALLDYEGKLVAFLAEVDAELKALEGWNVLKHEITEGVA